MLRFEWSAFATPQLTASLADLSGVEPAVAAQLQPLVAQIFQHVGGLPFVQVEPTLEERTGQGLAWLGEAVAHTLAQAGATHAPAGFTLEIDPKGYTASRVAARGKLNLNSANAAEIDALPGMPSRVAARVVAERRRAGRFRDLEDFEKRVDGIGPVKAQALRHAVVFDSPAARSGLALDAHADLGRNLRALMRLQTGGGAPGDEPNDPSLALGTALEAVLTTCATRPHPASRKGLLRQGATTPAPALAGPSHPVEWVGELWSKDYWQVLPGLLAGAARSIDLCMFHIAAPKRTHPTFALLEALRQAHERGVAVRALLDRDNQGDPYHSTVINSGARRFLQDAGVPCRSDSGERLLHSKYLILDAQRVVLGSHNWSAGSYFGFDDLSLCIASPALAAELGGRFEAQWNAGV